MDFLENISWGLIAPIFIIQLLLVVIALIDLLKISQTNGPKWVWALVIIFINILGPIVYFIIGRKQS
ncbi:PLD nuclease N-terminal domain-containing protein [Paenisporosarcina sp. TG-14]|uniref:PLD nuclease N-terminal domain-containing protein n=1 Tax=Paenisporosarcina sp. TG-14 TaxID=1231057 RepID=UPI0002FF9337|nr:PLD nuclease N-terminal domain-containing protein [Paenisporosarcina sp. TG-14]